MLIGIDSAFIMVREWLFTKLVDEIVPISLALIVYKLLSVLTLIAD